MASMESPCVRICVMDPVSGLCRGCARTLDEIVAWGTMTPDRRRTIMRELDQRMARVAAVETSQ
ncbi:DUF1289 domain-containing protein [Pannonibacter sp. SL95]|uniref:DUF1289 domain-containing protein n=1 Tax=Pannonibacter sp. SL95 TaxID=2995153 RepID=UPI002274F455|nr:DUF1289 domain-containing protein [Pannonibacter sp. SL95]MCY1706041.1 DUF1289 domain-containing protein [Pannonibacter sp. SL95]